MIDKLGQLWPEIVMLIGACVCLATGLAPTAAARKATGWVAAATLIVAGVIAYPVQPHGAAETMQLHALDAFASYVKVAVAVMGVLLLLISHDLPAGLRTSIQAEAAEDRGKPFEPGNVVRGEFYAFFLFSLTGVMLCGSATDLVWLFLALELTSLPTYVLVAIMRDKPDAQEAGVKYFFLGAMAAAVFLYGFAMIYGATGTTTLVSTDPNVTTVAGYVQERLDGGEALSPLLALGLVVSIIGIGFKIAAAPMQFYTADVYQGAATPVTAFLAFVPKTAGFVALAVLLQAGTGGRGELPEVVQTLIWIMAALTMTFGNVMGLLQTNLKRLLAYSSIAHSGYMMVGLLAVGTNQLGMPYALGKGIGGILFYLIAYGLSNLGAFAVLCSLQSRGEPAESIDDIKGLNRRHPLLAVIMLISVLSLIGLPPMIGFLGKVYLFGSAIEAGHVSIVVIAVINSAISAVYYLRIASACYFGEPTGDVTVHATASRRIAGGLAALGSILLGLTGGWLVDASSKAAAYNPPAPTPKVQKHVAAKAAPKSAATMTTKVPPAEETPRDSIPN